MRMGKDIRWRKEGREDTCFDGVWLRWKLPRGYTENLWQKCSFKNYGQGILSAFFTHMVFPPIFYSIL